MGNGETAGLVGNRPRYYSLDGLRGLAALLVVVFHASPVLGITNSSTISMRWLGLLISGFGGIAVAVFFLLSGFLLFSEFVEDLVEDSGRKSLSSYFSRRILRIYPAYWVALIFAELLIGPLIGGRFGVFTLTERYFDQDHPLVGLTIAWTLALEVSFYIFLPVFAVLLRQICRRLSNTGNRLVAILTAVVLLILLSGSYRIWAAHAFPLDTRLQFLLPQFLGWFGMGMLLSLGVIARRKLDWGDSIWFRVLTRKLFCWSLAIVSYIGAISVIGNDTLQIFDTSPWWKQETSHVLLGISACLVLLPLTVGPGAMMKRGFFSAPLVREVGLVSYGVYLWHDIILKYFSDEIFEHSGFLPFVILLCLIVPVSLVLGWLSFRFVERPAMRLSW